MLRSGELTGIFYLENHRLRSTFSPKRVELLSTLGTQAAISLSNARLHSDLKSALDKATESSRLKTEFLATTSHELRTPLNAIINIPEVLLESVLRTQAARCTACARIFELEENERIPEDKTCPGCSTAGALTQTTTFRFDDGEDVPRQLETVIGCAKHLLAVVGDILDSSKLEVGKMTLQTSLRPIRPLLDAVEAGLTPVANRGGVKLVVHPLSTDVQAKMDSVRISQVLFNLVANAIKFSDGKGTVQVRATEADGVVRIAVQDEGIGIAQEHQALIFESFRQVEGSGTRRFGGTGLGLYISKQIVTLHGGALTVDSELGKGSTFTVELPAKG